MAEHDEPQTEPDPKPGDRPLPTRVDPDLVREIEGTDPTGRGIVASISNDE